MSVNKVIELMSDSGKSWEDATEKAVQKASKSVKGIRSVWVKDMSATVDSNGKIQKYRGTVNVTFAIKD